MPTEPSLIGQTFGRCFVFATAPPAIEPSGYSRKRSYVRCACGNVFIAHNSNLRSGHTKSCGCFRREISSEANSTHRQSNTPTYISWRGMRNRCLNKKDRRYKDWGGRGIRICTGLSTFEGFRDFLGDRPAKMEIDRWPNNATGHYSCGQCEECQTNNWTKNVRWATYEQQNGNKRVSRIYTVRGVTDCIAALCRQFNVPANRVRFRLNMGWSINDAVFTPRYAKR